MLVGIFLTHIIFQRRAVLCDAIPDLFLLQKCLRATPILTFNSTLLFFFALSHCNSLSPSGLLSVLHVEWLFSFYSVFYVSIYTILLLGGLAQGQISYSYSLCYRTLWRQPLFTIQPHTNILIRKPTLQWIKLRFSTSTGTISRKHLAKRLRKYYTTKI